MGSVVYILQNPLTERDRLRFHVTGMMARGHQVLVLDVASLVFPAIPFDRSHYTAIRDVPVVVLKRWSDLRAFRDQLDGAALILFLAQSFGQWGGNLPALRAVSRARAPYAILQMNATPSTAVDAGGPAASLVRRLRGIRPGDAVIRRLPLSLLGIRPADYVICDGRRSVRPNPLVSPGTRRIIAHSFDYEAWRTDAGQCGSVRPVAVFLDQFLPFHRDFRELGGTPFVPEPYQAALRNLFDRIEASLGLEVEIATHPRAEYSANPFGGRRMVAGQTLRMVGEAQLVITHCSTASSWAVLFNKPLLVCATTDLLAYHPIIRGMIEGMAEHLGKRVAMLDSGEPDDLAGLLSVPAGAYRRYREEFLKVDGTPDQRLWDIVVDAINADGRTQL